MPMIERGLDVYFTPAEAIKSFLSIEKKIPMVIWEPAAGDGAIVKPLRNAGYRVIASDIADYGLVDCHKWHYLQTNVPNDIEGIITNPPFKLAAEFLQKALSEAPFVAFFLRTNFLEGTKRKAIFEANPPARVWISSRRLPMMHRFGYVGPKSTSNTCYAWFVWIRGNHSAEIKWFDWRD